MHIPVLNDLFIILGISIGVLYICTKLRLPTIIGFLLTGMFVGPYGTGLIHDVHNVEVLAEIGVILLLFTIGIEFSVEEFSRLKKSVLVGGALQVGMTIFAVYLLLTQFGFTESQGVFSGFLLALSSTAIVLKLLQERGEMGSPFGKTALSVLIFQDIIIVPMMLVTPILGGAAENVTQSIVMMLAKGFVFIGGIFLSAKYIFPALLYQIIKSRNRELFLLTVLVIGLGITWISASLGLSLGLGAFIAGLVISESEYSHHALEGILPFRDVFISFFFVSVGMLLNLNYMFSNIAEVLPIALVVMTLKGFLAIAAVILLGFPLKIAVLTGMSISQIGEFSFILSKVGNEFGLISGDHYQLFLSISIITMILTPFSIALSPKVAVLAQNLPLPTRIKAGLKSSLDMGAQSEKTRLKDHLIIVGFGLNGRNLAHAARASNIPYVVIEMNAETVRLEREKGEPIYYGDASQEAELMHRGIKSARIVVIAIADAAATRRVTDKAKQLNPNVYIITRTRFVAEMKPLYSLGANEVIPEEYETSVEIFTRVLSKYLVPPDQINHFIKEIRADGYEMLREHNSRSSTMRDLQIHLSDMELATVRARLRSFVVGKSLAETNLRKAFGVNVVAVRRSGQMHPNPPGSWVFEPDDDLIIFANVDQIADFTRALNVVH